MVIKTAEDVPLLFTLHGQMPSGKGQVRTAVIHGRVMKFPNERFKAWRALAWNELQGQRRGRSTIVAPSVVDVFYVPGDLNRRDVPGMMDALCHLLEWCAFHGKDKKIKCSHRTVADDSLLHHWNWRRGELDRENPRIEVTISIYPNLLPL